MKDVSFSYPSLYNAYITTSLETGSGQTVTNAPTDKKQDKLDKRAAALKANMMRRKERMKEMKQQDKDKNDNTDSE